MFGLGEEEPSYHDHTRNMRQDRDTRDGMPDRERRQQPDRKQRREGEADEPEFARMRAADDVTISRRR